MARHHGSGASSAPYESVRRFLRRHRRPLVMWLSCGLLISWVLKDVFTESAKDQVATLSSARTTFYLRSDTLKFGDEIAKHITVDNSDASQLTPAQVEAEIQQQLLEDFRASMISNHLSDAVKQLSKDVDDLKESERTQVDSFYDENLARANTVQAINETVQRHASTSRDLQTARQLASDASSLDYQMIDLGTLLADRVDHQLARAERKRTVFAWATYISTFLLWSVVFVSRDANIDVPGGEF